MPAMNTAKSHCSGSSGMRTWLGLGLALGHAHRQLPAAEGAARRAGAERQRRGPHEVAEAVVRGGAHDARGHHRGERRPEHHGVGHLGEQAERWRHDDAAPDAE
eukprot:scaffold36683_cov57-Phaeocystis_antarctica.AAC.6